jgi:hypothetical protein
MNLKSLPAALAGAVIFSSAPLLASAATPQPGPIHIDTVEVWAPEDYVGAGDTLDFPRSLRIAFTNDNNSRATEVVFAVLNRGSVAKRLDDVGSFTPGVAIDHTFANQSGGIQAVAVAQVKFADGSVWNNPAVPAEPPVLVIPGVPVSTANY